MGLYSAVSFVRAGMSKVSSRVSLLVSLNRVVGILQDGDPGLEITCYFCHILLVKTGLRARTDSSGKEASPPLVEGVARSQCQKAWG